MVSPSTQYPSALPDDQDPDRISLRDEISTATTSRVTLVFRKKGNEWRITHGHFSNVPK
jgi:hypothetical protein